jgi:two-component system, NarL family, nitrate/nitrite response regulator NarL
MHPMEKDSERRTIQPIQERELPLQDRVDREALARYASNARVVIVSGLRLLRDGLADALTQSSGITVAATAPDAQWARTVIHDHAPAIVLIDMELQDSLALVRAIRSAPNAPRIVVFAMSESHDALLPYIEAGIHGYVPRDGSLSDVVATVESVSRGETIVSPKLAASLFERLVEQRRHLELGGAAASNHAFLTVRERQILSLVEQGMTNKEIARALGIELATVKNHVHNLLDKLKVSRRGQAAARARDNGKEI